MDYGKHYKNKEIVQKITLYTHLKELNLRMCDFIPDEILILLKLYRCFIKIYNYYGE